MVEGPDTLQRSPVLKPQHTLHRVRTYTIQSHHERPLHKILDQRPRFLRHVPAFFLDRDGSLEPDDQMRNARGDAIGPVVAEDLIVCGIGEGNRVPKGERRLPAQSTLADVVGYGAILSLDFRRPSDIADQIGGLPFQRPEVIARDDVLEILPVVQDKLVVCLGQDLAVRFGEGEGGLF